MGFESRFNFTVLEPELRYEWEKSKVYKYDEKSYDDSFVIDTPPPTVSGNLHMGHVFSYCHTDFIARYKRLIGMNVFYPIGFDDNGLPTERLVEKVKKVRAFKVELPDFLNMCKEVSEDAKGNFRRLFKGLGISFDWDLEYGTSEPKSCKVSQESFMDLYKKGFIYRKIMPVIWDPKDRTAIANAEVEEKEFNSRMYKIDFKSELGYVATIATTRPELLSACVAVFFHPDDLRYKHLADSKAIVPLFGFKVPFLPDEDVKTDKGTGLVMCCTFGDEQDVRWWERHGLPLKLIINEAGKIHSAPVLQSDSEGIAELADGKDVSTARALIVDKLTEARFISGVEEIAHSVRCAERSGAALEIRMSPQWFVNLSDHKNTFMEKMNEIGWYPEQMKKRLEIWIENLNSDWCISRQRYLGVRFPVWYSKRKGEEGKILLPNPADLPVDPDNAFPQGYSRDEIIPEKDVMDTWATSSLTPQIAATANLYFHKEPLPADLRAQSHEIIRTWAFYTIVKSVFHSNIVPWKNIMISGWCLAKDKTKMSKSKGNIVEPESILSQYGADVVRFWAAKASLGSDIVLQQDSLKPGVRFVNKLWNAARFVEYFIIEDFSCSSITEVIDFWILNKFINAVTQAQNYFEKFDYCSALDVLETFFWNDFCDFYLEIVKKRAYGADDYRLEEVTSARNCLSYIMYNLLIVFSPFVPFVADALFKGLFPSKKLSVNTRGNWSLSCVVIKNEESVLLGDYCVEIVAGVRKIKSSLNLSVGADIQSVFITPFVMCTKLDLIVKDVRNVCRAADVFFAEGVEGDNRLVTGNFKITIVV